MIHDAYEKYIRDTFTDVDNDLIDYAIPEDTLYYLKDQNFVEYFEAQLAQEQALGVVATAKESFSKALLEVCMLFGHPHWSPREAMINALFHQGSVAVAWL